MTQHIDAAAFDTGKADAFLDRVAGLVNDGAIAVMVGLGHRTGLFDTLAGMPLATSTELAEEAALAERYVREWLAVMVTARIVAFDPTRGTYSLPAEHAASLTRGASLGNLAVYAQHVGLLGQVQERLLTCFETGEGMSYDDYPCFHHLMAEDSAMTVTAGLFDHILPLVPGIDLRLEGGIDVLDAGCGQGHALIALAARYPRSRFVGYDLSGEAISHAAEVARRAGLENLTFETRDLTGYDERERFDFIASFDAVHDQKDPAGLIRGLKGALKPGGVYLMQDIGGSARLENNLDFPMASFLYAISCAHCTPVSLGQGGEGLGTMWGWETAERMLRDAGFTDVSRRVLPHDPMNVWFVASE
ncbi:class I SAM-dependent methyltransferase [Silicimonas algicola]|uniref:Methyltransferase family protein n=1 Tax=Silicimonas algicola TaxID=1826607 RepID=A0A316GBD1_9RHOB|nr:class I SAM-dependent methyltransferase [Silicimonas algicola]AZQ65938.1 class I SAM-dependent methyltransferase [Silicimonas algicola]PWK58224.1 methyltransferase family protein [Silicimonas algicola]